MISELVSRWNKLMQNDKIYREVARDDVDYFREYRDDLLQDIGIDPETATGDDETAAIKNFIDNRFEDFEAQFYTYARTENGMLKIFRCIGIEDEDEFLFHIANETPVGDYKGLGIYWSWEKSKADCHWGQGSKTHLIVEALVPMKSIDIEYTLLKNLNPSLGEDEAEIQLKEGAELKVIGVKLADGERLELPEPVRMTASLKPDLYRTVKKYIPLPTVGSRD